MVVFAQNVFVLVSSEQLLLSILMLFICVLKVPEFRIQLVEGVLLVLNDCVSFTNFVDCLGYCVLFLVQDVLKTAGSLIVVAAFSF